jgi:hypothetical protein
VRAPEHELFSTDLIDDMHATFEAACSKLGLLPASDKATELVATKIVELAKAGRRGEELTVETLRFFEHSRPRAKGRPGAPRAKRKCRLAGTVCRTNVPLSCKRSKTTAITPKSAAEWLGVPGPRKNMTCCKTWRAHGTTSRCTGRSNLRDNSASRLYWRETIGRPLGPLSRWNKDLTIRRHVAPAVRNFA